MKSFDPRPLSRRTDLGVQKIEYDADTASINKRTMQMNADAQRKYSEAVAARSPAKTRTRTGGKQESWLASAVNGMRRRASM